MSKTVNKWGDSFAGVAYGLLINSPNKKRPSKLTEMVNGQMNPHFFAFGLGQQAIFFWQLVFALVANEYTKDLLERVVYVNRLTLCAFRVERWIKEHRYTSMPTKSAST